jgi:hypothetical protein
MLIPLIYWIATHLDLGICRSTGVAHEWRA